MICQVLFKIFINAIGDPPGQSGPVLPGIQLPVFPGITQITALDNKGRDLGPVDGGIVVGPDGPAAFLPHSLRGG